MRNSVQTKKQHSKILFTYLSLFTFGLLLITANARAALLTFNGEQKQGVAGVENLSGIVAVVQSPDGKQVYVTALGINGGLTTFNRDLGTGKLQFNQAGKIDNSDLINLAFSPDAKHLYATTLRDKLVVLERDTSTGVVALKNTLSNVPGLVNTFLVTVSADGKHVYVLSRNTSGSDVLAVFSRDVVTGDLSPIDQYFDNVGKVRGLAKASAMALSADGRSIYITSPSTNSVSLFSRDASTGAVQFIEQLSAATPAVRGLAGASDVEISADGKQLYVTSPLENALAVFARHSTTGRLSLIEVHDTQSNAALVGARGIGVTQDGKHIFIAAPLSDAISVYQRDALTGQLTFSEAIVANAELAGLKGVESLSVSADGSSIYVAPLAGAVISAFQISTTAAAINADAAIGDAETKNPPLVNGDQPTTQAAGNTGNGGGGGIDLFALAVLLFVAGVDLSVREFAGSNRVDHRSIFGTNNSAVPSLRRLNVGLHPTGTCLYTILR